MKNKLRKKNKDQNIVYDSMCCRFKSYSFNLSDLEVKK